MGSAAHRYTRRTGRNTTDYQTTLGCDDCQSIAGTVHHVISRRRETIDADLSIEGVQWIDLGQFGDAKAAALAITKLHRVIMHNR